MRAVNLMPRDERRAHLEAGRLPLIGAAGGVVLVTALAFFLASSASDSASESRREAQAIEATIALLPKKQGTGATTGTLAQERSERVAALSAALTSRTAFDRVLRDISLVLPRDVWLTQLEASAPEPATPLAGAAGTPPPAAATGVTIQGATYSHESVATMLARLAIVPSLTGVRLTGTSLVEPQADEGSGPSQPSKPGRPFVTFIISASVRTGGAS